MIELTNLEAAERSSGRARRTGRTVPCVLVAVALTLGLALRANGQGSVGAVRGVARSEADGTPIPFVLVRLLLSDSKDGARRQGITNAQGRFQFDSVPSGTYRLQLLRIGFRPALSSPIDVRVGETTEQEVRASMIGIPLPTVMVYAENACLTGDRVAKDPYLSALWEEVRNGVEIRRAFDRRYRYQRVLGQASETAVPSRPVVQRQRADTVLSEPDSVDVRAERTRARRASEGFGKGNTLVLPDEGELTDDAFLRTHCVVPTILESGGASGIRFRETSRGRGIGIQGTIWVDAASRLMRHLELEYLNGDRAFCTLSVEYAEVAIAGTTLRLPVTGAVSLWPVEAPRGTIVTATLSFGYSRFEEVRAKSPEGFASSHFNSAR